MKKIVSTFLASLMLMPCIASAAPAMASTVEEAYEASLQQNEDNSNKEALIFDETQPIKTIFIDFGSRSDFSINPSFMENIDTLEGTWHVKASNNDPMAYIAVDFYADSYEAFKIRMKWDCIARTDGKAPVCQIYYTGTDENGDALTLSEANSVKTEITLSSDGEYAVVEIPFAEKMAGSRITQLRFDPVNCDGEIYLDYLSIVPKNENKNLEWSFNTDGDTEGWIYGNLVSAPTVSDGILRGTAKDTVTNGYVAKTGLNYAGSDYPKAYVRLMADGLTKDVSSIFYTDLYDADGTKLKNWSISYTDKNGNTYHAAVVTVPCAENGNYKVYEYNFGKFVPYSENYITSMFFNVQHVGVQMNFDYVVFPHKDNYEWTFEHEELWNGFKPSSSDMQIKNGKLVAKKEETYNNYRLTMNNIELDADKWAGVEIVMKHDIANEGTRGQVYYTGTDASGSAISIGESNAVPNYFTQTSTGEGYNYYYYDLSSKANWAGSTINMLRFDIVKGIADYEVEYIRLVPNPKGEDVNLDESIMELKYEFEDNIKGHADGKISIDFGGQPVNAVKSVVLKWAKGNAQEGYTALDDYSAIKTLEATEASEGYTINKNQLIPTSATALVATVKDLYKTFELVYEIPAHKRNADRGAPLYTVGLISDIHVGGWGSEKGPNVRLAAAREQLSKLSDFVVVNGDLTQWYGAYSGEEFKAYNYDGTTYTDNGETSTEYLGIGTSQWTTLTDYFKGFSVPVYAVQGNHDIKDSSNWSNMIESEKYFRPFLEDWISYSNTAENGSKYENAAVLNDNNNYYDTEINGHHYIFLTIPKTEAPTYSFGEEQLAWLDKKLYEKEKSGKPIFVFGHVPLETLLNGSYWDDQIGDDEKIKAILEKHPSAIYTSGHTHYSLDVDFLSSVDGAQDTFSLIHDGGTTTINVPNSEDNPDKTTEVTGSHGVVAKVYSDGIELWGRDFVNSKWISRGYTYLTFKSECTIDEVSVEKRVEQDGIVLRADNIVGVTYTWILNGEESDVASNEITLGADFEGYAALRLTAEDGSYRSVVVDNISQAEAVSEKSVSLRMSDGVKPSGIRFAASINDENREKAVEYGFIVTRKTFLDMLNKPLTFDLTSMDGKPYYVYGKNYLKDADGNILEDLVFSRLEDTVKFTGVLTGIDTNDASQVCEMLVARPYVKFEDKVMYGETVSASLNEIARSIRDSEHEYYFLHKEFIDKLADMSK